MVSGNSKSILMLGGSPTQHRELHHYTSSAGFAGIVQSNTIWATHYSGLNDTSEFSYAREIVISALAQSMKGYKGAPGRTIEFVRGLIDLEFDIWFRGYQEEGKWMAPTMRPFVASFCSHAGDQEYERENGLLSQWRGYGAGGGFCLVFDTEELVELLLDEFETGYWFGMHVVDVVYGHEDKKIEEVGRQLANYLEPVLARISRNLRAKKANTARFAAEFMIAISRLKHQGFREEREVRTVISPSLSQVPGDRLHKRQIRQLDVEYVALFEGLKRKLPLKRVIVGPARNQADNVVKARKLLGSQIKIVRSVTPYIE